MEMINILVLISLFLFYLLFIGRTVILYKRGVKVWVIGTSSKKMFELILENILMPVLILWSVFVVLTALNISMSNMISRFVLNISWFKYIGIIFCYVGLLIFLMSLISFGQSWRIGIDEQNSNTLVTTGIFKYSRNPIFLFMNLYFIGVMLIYPNIIFIVVATCAIIGIHLQIKREENFLLKKFGEEYIKYKRKTRRYL